MDIDLTVNGGRVAVDVEPRVLLVELLRDVLGLTGTKIGCDTAQCGTCAIELNGRSVKSCSVLAVQADGATITTIEGVAGDTELTALQDALCREAAVQCGFCIPGMVISLRDLLTRRPAPTEAEVRRWLAGNLCRCTGYQAVVRAVLGLAVPSAAEPAPDGAVPAVPTEPVEPVAIPERLAPVATGERRS